MFYRFNSLAGRLVSSGQLQAYLPQGLKPSTSESSQIIYATGAHFSEVKNFTKKRSAYSTSGGSSGGEDEFGEVPQRIQDLQKKFQVDDGVPVHLKGGTGDKILYGITIAIATVGLAECLRLYYNLAWPKKPE